MRRLKILIWHVHGGYLNALAQIDHDWYLPVKPGRPAGYIGRDLDLVIFRRPKTITRIDSRS